MKTNTTISLVRHPHVYNPSKVFYGRLSGFPLSLLGLEQARRTTEYFREKPIDAIFSSPRLRARQTAWLLAESRGMNQIHICKLLDEVYSFFDGHPIQELIDRNWDIYTGISTPYEQPADVLVRMQAFLAQIRLQYAGCHVVAVTHGDPISFALLWASGHSIAPGIKPDPYPEHASISTFCFSNGQNDEMPSCDRYVSA